MSQKHYKAFISYSHEDEAFGLWLHKELEKYKIPKKLREDHPNLPKTLYPIFRDRYELNAGDDLGVEIPKALENSDALIVVCSTKSADSKWVNKEIIDFKMMHGEDRIFPIILDGEPFARESDKIDDELECFPEALKYKVDSEGNLTDEQTSILASSAIEKEDGRELAKLKLIAGVLGVPFGEFYRRDEEQKRRDRNQFIGIWSIVFFLMLGLTIFSLIQVENVKKKEQGMKNELAKAYYFNSLIDMKYKKLNLNAKINFAKAIKISNDNKILEPSKLLFHNLEDYKIIDMFHNNLGKHDSIFYAEKLLYITTLESNNTCISIYDIHKEKYINKKCFKNNIFLLQNDNSLWDNEITGRSMIINNKIFHISDIHQKIMVFNKNTLELLLNENFDEFKYSVTNKYFTSLNKKTISVYRNNTLKEIFKLKKNYLKNVKKLKIVGNKLYLTFKDKLMIYNFLDKNYQCKTISIESGYDFIVYGINKIAYIYKGDIFELNNKIKISILSIQNDEKKDYFINMSEKDFIVEDLNITENRDFNEKLKSKLLIKIYSSLSDNYLSSSNYQSVKNIYLHEDDIFDYNFYSSSLGGMGVCAICIDENQCIIHDGAEKDIRLYSFKNIDNEFIEKSESIEIPLLMESENDEDINEKNKIYADSKSRTYYLINKKYIYNITFNSKKIPMRIKSNQYNQLHNLFTDDKKGYERELNITTYLNAWYGDVYHQGFDIYDGFKNKILDLGYDSVQSVNIDVRHNILYYLAGYYENDFVSNLSSKKNYMFHDENNNEYLLYKYLLYPNQKDYYSLYVKVYLGIDLNKKILSIEEWKKSKQKYEQILKELNL